MPKYVDGFVIPVPKKNLKVYVKMARQGRKIWMKHGALDYYECVGDDLKSAFSQTFPKGLRIKNGETVVFSYIVFKSKAHRDSVNKRVMSDPKLMEGFDKTMPFDVKRMLYGGFKAVVVG